MKTLISAAILLLLIIGVNAQSAKDIFTAEKIIWYGLDYSHASLIGIGAKPEKAKDVYVTECNNASYYDREIFQLESAFGKRLIPVDNKVVAARNDATPYEKMESSTRNSIDNTTLVKIVSEYKNGIKKEGIGAAFIVEYLDKKDKGVGGHIVFFDIATQKLLFTKRLTEEAKVVVKAVKATDGRGRGEIIIGRDTNPNTTLHWTVAFGKIFDAMGAEYLHEWKKEVMGTK